MDDLNKVKVATDSIDHVFFAVEVPVEDNDAPDIQIALVHRADASDQQWQYVVSALAAALNDATDEARSIRNKARLEVAEYTPY